MSLPLNYPVAAGQPILASEWNDMAELVNKFRIHPGKLEIKADVELEGNSGFNSPGETATLCLGDSNHFIRATNAVGVTISTFGNDPGIFLKEGGNVGIGTSAPIAKLQIKAGAIMPQEGNSDNAGILFPPNAYGGGGDKAYIRYYARSGEETTLEIGNQNDGGDHIALMPSGNVGIGTSAPIAKLQVKAGAVMLQEGNNDNAGILFPPNAYGGSGDKAYIRYYARPGGSGEDTTLEIGNQNDAEDHIALMPSGNVGIGTGDPKAILHVNGNAGTLNLEGSDHTYIQFYPNSYGNGRKAWVGFGSGGTNILSISNAESNGDLDLRTNKKVTVNSNPLLKIVTFTAVPFSGTSYDTFYPTAQWNAIIGGTNAMVNGKPLYMQPSGSTWNIVKPEITLVSGSFSITVLFIRKEISQL